MSLLDRIRATRLAPANKMLPPPPENKVANPDTPIPELPAPITQLVNLCAHCGKEGAEHQYTTGDPYLYTLPYTFLCDDCSEKRLWLVKHPVARRHTIQEHAAIPARPRMKAAQMPLEDARTPSGSLIDRTHNLATGI